MSPERQGPEAIDPKVIDPKAMSPERQGRQAIKKEIAWKPDRPDWIKTCHVQQPNILRDMNRISSQLLRTKQNNLKQRMNDWLTDWMHQWMHECTNGWINRKEGRNEFQMNCLIQSFLSIRNSLTIHYILGRYGMVMTPINSKCQRSK